MEDCLLLWAHSTQMKLFLKTKSTLFLNNGLFRSLLSTVFSKLLFPAEFTKSYHVDIPLPPFQINPRATFSSGSIRDRWSILPLTFNRWIKHHVMNSAGLLSFIQRASSLSRNHNNHWLFFTLYISRPIILFANVLIIP